jgi:hypothetical protein
MNFLKTPFIPDGDVSLAVVDYRISPAISAKLNEKGIECIKTVRCPGLYSAVDGHPDMLMFHIGGKRIVLAPNIYEDMAPLLEKKGFAVTKGATWLVRNYPGNIAYNVLRVGDVVFHNIRYTDAEIIKAINEENLTILNVGQGYTKCSVCILDGRTIITSDRKISETAGKYGIESFLIKPGGIELKGMNYGFIGGASGLLSERQIAFSGSLKGLEDNYKLVDFINGKGFEIIYLSEGRLADYGSILPLKCR